MPVADRFQLVSGASPEGDGGELIAAGLPEAIVAEPHSYTGQFPKELLERRSKTEALGGGAIRGAPRTLIEGRETRLRT